MRVNKYGAKKTACRHNHEHSSAKEARHCNDLHLLERAGEITHLEIEPQYYFTVNDIPLKHDNGRRAGYKPDFSFRERNGQQVVVDTKGYVVRDWPLRKALFKACFPHIELREV